LCSLAHLLRTGHHLRNIASHNQNCVSHELSTLSNNVMTVGVENQFSCFVNDDAGQEASNHVPISTQIAKRSYSSTIADPNSTSDMDSIFDANNDI
ncbi:hypothetical protein KCU84_g5, partial [Aureobasidium melanogenum]